MNNDTQNLEQQRGFYRKILRKKSQWWLLFDTKLLLTITWKMCSCSPT